MRLAPVGVRHWVDTTCLEGFLRIALRKIYTVLLEVLQGFYYKNSTRFYWEFYRGSTIQVLHGFTGRSAGILLSGSYTVLLGVIQGALP